VFGSSFLFIAIPFGMAEGKGAWHTFKLCLISFKLAAITIAGGYILWLILL
jgi:hypothetical protein